MPPMADGAAATAMWVLVEETEIEALAGDSAGAQRFTVGGATVLLGPSGSVIITTAGDVPGHSGVWSAEEVRLVGPAPAPVTKRLLGDSEVWGADESSLPIHLRRRSSTTRSCTGPLLRPIARPVYLGREALRCLFRRRRVRHAPCVSRGPRPAWSSVRLCHRC